MTSRWSPALTAVSSATRDRGEARGGQNRSGGAGDFRPGVFQRLGGRRAQRAIDEALAVPRFEIGERRLQHGRAAIDRRIDEAELLERVAPGMNQFCARAPVPSAMAGLIWTSGENLWRENLVAANLAAGKGARQGRRRARSSLLFGGFGFRLVQMAFDESRPQAARRAAKGEMETKASCSFST